MSKKLPHQHNIEDLLKALEDVKNDDISDELISFDNDVPFFLSKFKIENGKYTVRISLLYKLYKIYSKEPLKQNQFTRNVGNFVINDGHYFNINISPEKIIKILNPPQNRNEIARSAIHKHFTTFVENCKVKKGQKWIEAFLLFEVYRHYCIDKKIHKLMRYENFVSVCKLNFEHRRIGSSKGVWLKLDPEILSILTPELMEKIRERRKKDEKWSEARKKKQPK